jgi:aldehyde dehydrogenase (NAD+)
MLSRLAFRLPSAPIRSVAACLTHVRAFSAPPKVNIRRTEALIANEWKKGSHQFPTLNPATEEVIAHVTHSGKAEVDAAVAAAQEAFYGPKWSKLGGYERGLLLYRLADLIEKHKEELILLEVLDNGKGISEATSGDMALVLQCFRYYAGWADKIHGSVINPSGPFAKGLFGYTEREPVGVVGQIVPWNFPLLMAAWKLGPALAAGCTVVLKPAEQTPLTALRLGELIVEAGFPAGVVNIVPGDGETGKLVASHPGLDKIAFTGSTEVGHEIMRTASKNFKRVTLELGGKSPLIVCADADLDKAAAGAHVALFLNQGQCCCAGSRIYVDEKIYDKFVEKSIQLAKSRKLGYGWLLDTQQGPQVSQEQQEKILEYIKSGKEQGARLLLGGGRGNFKKGYFVEPTVFADVRDDMKIAQEEIFGPVMSILKYKSIDEVIQRANKTKYGLAGSVWTQNFAVAQKIVKSLRAGSIWVNCYDTFDAALPFGGFKHSGIGRELGPQGLDNYLETKTVVHNTAL